jgi:hypothetical protein
VNRLNATVAPTHNRNARLTKWNWLVAVPGGLFMLLALTAIFLPPDGR